MAAIAYRVIPVLPQLAAGGQKDDLRNKCYIWACRKFSWWCKYYLSNQISSIWPPISKMAAIGYPKILSFTSKITADSQRRWFGKTDVNIACNFNVNDMNKYCLNVFNMAVIFQDDRHGLFWTTTLCLKVAANSQKMILVINDIYGTLRMLIWFHKQSKCSDVCNMAAIFQYGRHGQWQVTHLYD